MTAGSGDAWPEDYEQGRPGWPPEAVAVAGTRPAATVLDLGAGTGKLTRLLVERFSRVIAVEPAPAMRRVLERVCPRADVHAGSSSQIPLPYASVDAVFAAQAFHWFDDLDEIVRVLRPGGALVAMFNSPDGPVTPPVDDVEALLMAREPSDVNHLPLDLGNPVPEQLEFQHARFTNPQVLDRDGLVAFYASMGWFADLPDAERLLLREEVRERLTADRYERVWATDVYWIVEPSRPRVRP